MYDFEEEKNQNNLKSFQVHIFTFQKFLHLFTFKKEKTIKLRTGDAPPPHVLLTPPLVVMCNYIPKCFCRRTEIREKLKSLRLKKAYYIIWQKRLGLLCTSLKSYKRGSNVNVMALHIEMSIQHKYICICVFKKKICQSYWMQS